MNVAESCRPGRIIIQDGSSEAAKTHTRAGVGGGGAEGRLLHTSYGRFTVGPYPNISKMLLRQGCCSL